MSDLPPGFVLDQPAAPVAAPQAAGLPAGFVLDNAGGSSASGVAKSLGTGLAQGVIGLAGLPADLAHLYAPDKSDANPLGSEGIQKAIEAKTGEFYKPQGTAEEIASKVGQFAPAVIGGPETMAAKLATRVVAPAVASEAAGKLTEGTAAQPYAEIAGALAGGAGAAMTASKLSALRAARGAAEVPSVTDLKAAARAQYQHPDVQAVQIKPEAVSSLADKIEADLQHGPNSGFRAFNEPKVFGAIDELRTPSGAAPAASQASETMVPLNEVTFERHMVAPRRADGSLPASYSNLESYLREVEKPQNLGARPKSIVLDKNGNLSGMGMEAAPTVATGRPATIADLDNVRQVLGNAAKERDATGQLTRQAVAANRAIDHIDNFLPNLQQPDLIAGDAAKANGILDTARQNWGAAKRAEQVQTLAANAEINAASANSGANIQNATKQAFKPLLKNNYAKAGGYSDLEKQALNKIVRGTWTGTLARGAGNVLGGGGGLGMLAGGAAGYEEGGVPGAIAVGLAGRGLKMIGNRSTLNAVKNLDTLLRSRAPEALKVAAQNPKIVQLLPSDSVKALRAMILAEPGLAKISNGPASGGDQKRQPVGQPGS